MSDSCLLSFSHVHTANAAVCPPFHHFSRHTYCCNRLPWWSQEVMMNRHRNSRKSQKVKSSLPHTGHTLLSLLSHTQQYTLQPEATVAADMAGQANTANSMVAVVQLPNGTGDCCEACSRAPLIWQHSSLLAAPAHTIEEAAEAGLQSDAYSHTVSWQARGGAPAAPSCLLHYAP